MKLEVHEKIRSRIRAAKILSDLWELGYKFYMVGIVRLNATSFMLWVFVFVQALASCRFVLSARRRRSWRTRTKLCSGLFGSFGLFAFTIHTPRLTFTPLDLFVLFFIFFFSYFHIYCFYLFFQNNKNPKNNFFIFYNFILFFIFFT